MAKSEPRIISGWRWLGRIAIVGVALIVVTSAAWYAWLWETTRRCDALIAAIRARGERVSWDGLQTPADVPDEQNSAYYLQQAGNAMVLPPAPPSYQQWLASGAATRPASRPAPVPWQTTAKANVASNAKALALMRRARECTRTAWKPVPPAGFPIYTNMSSLARLVRDDALLLHENGEEQKAIERWRDTEAAARSMATGPHTLIAGLITVILDGIGMETMKAIAPDIRIGGPDGVSGDEVRRLIAELLDDSMSPNAVASGWLAERTFQTDAYAKGRYSASPFLLQPLLYSQMHLAWTRLGTLARDAREMRVTPSVEVDDYNRLIGIIPQFTNASSDVIWTVLQRRVVALTLAIQLHRHETGRYPVWLDDLVPGYLKSVPQYPETNSGRVIGYLLADDGRRPVIYIALSGVKPAELLRGLPKTQSALGSSYLPLGTVGYLDASVWKAGAGPSTRQSLIDHDKQPDARGKNDQPNTDGKKK